MRNVASPARPALLVVQAVTGRMPSTPNAVSSPSDASRRPTCRSMIRQISQAYLRAESADGQWRIVDSSPGWHVRRRLTKDLGNGHRQDDRPIRRPCRGNALTFEIVRPPKSIEPQDDSDDDDSVIQTRNRTPAWLAPEPPPPRVVVSSTSVSAALPRTGSSTPERSSLSKRAAAGRANEPGPSSRRCCSGLPEPSRESAVASPSTRRRQRHRPLGR